jgi:uncharacterized protein (TIGR02266 family)
MFEKRKTHRIQTSMAVAFSKAGDFLSANIMNISSSGVFIETETVLPPETELALRIRLPEDLEIMDIVGKVVWTKQMNHASPPGMGIQFTKISARHYQKIHCFVENCWQKMQEHYPRTIAENAAVL